MKIRMTRNYGVTATGEAWLKKGEVYETDELFEDHANGHKLGVELLSGRKAEVEGEADQLFSQRETATEDVPAKRSPRRKKATP